ncbi:histidine kinase dimerization/phospho-acceptor domain-containing protein, partial [Bifidobacterium breve]|uniref:histidine kinase dimerization/phospho-acceptor domain-containing protein n=1 Tax=Bifidobacterium breve TaxID=1685 RepID=UPI003AFA5576
MPASAPEAVARMKEHHNRKKNMFFGHFDRISLSSKLVACTIAVLLIGVSVISFSIRALVSNYMLSKTDNQLKSQSQMVFENIVTLAKNDNAGPNSYFLQIQYTDGTLDNEGNPLVVTPLMPQLQDGIVSVPMLPTNGDTSDITFGQPFTTQAVVKQVVQVQNNSSDSNNTTKPQTDPNTQDDAGNDAGNSGSKNAPNSSNSVTTILSNPSSNANHAAVSTARSPWRILPMTFTENGKERAVVYIGLSLSDQIDIVSTLSRYCVVVGIAAVLLGGSLATLIIQHTMTPLKRMEKTAAKIAAGDLSQRIPSAPENTEVGSLAASLNTMLTRIELSFHEQEETTDKMKRFVSDASHELRTPLAAIHGYAELYKMQRDMPGALDRADESIEHIERSSQRMTVLVEDLLSLARLDEG